MDIVLNCLCNDMYIYLCISSHYGHGRSPCLQQCASSQPGRISFSRSYEYRTQPSRKDLQFLLLRSYRRRLSIGFPLVSRKSQDQSAISTRTRTSLSFFFLSACIEVRKRLLDSRAKERRVCGVRLVSAVEKKEEYSTTSVSTKEGEGRPVG